jgi:hypothetical protein
MVSVLLVTNVAFALHDPKNHANIHALMGTILKKDLPRRCSRPFMC